MTDTYDITDIEDVYENAIRSGQNILRNAIIKANSKELKHAATRHSKDNFDEAYDVGYRAGLEQALKIAQDAKAEL